MTKYYKIFVPCEDVVATGGVDLIEHFEHTEDESPRNEGDPRHKNLVVIPFSLLDKIDPDSGNDDNLSFKAREVLAYLVQQRRTAHERGARGGVIEILQGLDMQFIEDRSSSKKKRQGSSPSYVESAVSLERAIQQALNLQGGQRPVFITNRDKYEIQLQERGMIVEPAKALRIDEDVVNEGVIEGTQKLESALHDAGEEGLPLSDVRKHIGDEHPLFVNKFIRFPGDKHDIYARIVAKLRRNGPGTRITGTSDERLVYLPESDYARQLRIGQWVDDNILGIKPYDFEQFLALQYGLLNPDCSTVCLCGSQGSGKTVLGYCSAVFQMLKFSKNERQLFGWPVNRETLYDKMLLLKAMTLMGGEDADMHIGFKPGTEWDKLKGLLKPYADAHKETVMDRQFDFKEMFLHPRHSNDVGDKRKAEKIEDERSSLIGYLPPRQEAVELTWPGEMGGRSLSHAYIVIDEVQNFTVDIAKMCIERAGINSKTVLMGDPFQTRNKRCRSHRNGLVNTIHYLIHKKVPYLFLINLHQNYRSQLSDDIRGMPT